MGVWSTSITGNDLAMDLRTEYTAAFYRYDISDALIKIEEYVRADGINESNEAEWCDYVYSLTDFMWKKGILTDDVLCRTLSMIDCGFGLDAWAEEGAAMLKAHKKALEKFRAKITSPQPPRKKIKPDVYLNDIFSHGDLIAMQLQTAGKRYFRSEVRSMSEEFFHSLDGKYILIQKVGCHVSWTSKIAPEIKDHWPVFRLFQGVYDTIPTEINYSTLKTAKIDQGHSPFNSFCTESSLLYFKRRKYQILGQYDAPTDNSGGQVFLSVDNDFYNADSDLVAAVAKQKTLLQRLFRL